MSVEELRISAHKLERKSRFGECRSIAACILVLVFFSRALLNPRSMLLPIAWPAASLWSIQLGCALICLGAAYEAYKAFKRLGSWRLANDTTFETTLRSYRTLLENRRNFFERMWRNKALWLLLTGLVFAAVPMTLNEFHRTPQTLLAAAPLAGLFAIWCVAMIVIRSRSQRKLQQEIDQLRAFESE